MNLELFFNYKNQLMNDLLTNDEIVRLLHDDCKLIDDPASLMYRQVFPFEYVPETIEHGQTFICSEVDIQRGTDLYLQATLSVWVFTHKSKMRLPNGGGLRIDRLCNEIAKAVNGSRDYGLGTMDLYSARRFAPIADYQGRMLTFHTTDISKLNPNPHPVPKNRVYG